MQDILFSQALDSEADGSLEKSQIRIITAALFFAFSIGTSLAPSLAS
jgi:hypothetical protein